MTPMHTAAAGTGMTAALDPTRRCRRSLVYFSGARISNSRLRLFQSLQCTGKFHANATLTFSRRRSRGSRPSVISFDSWQAGFGTGVQGRGAVLPGDGGADDLAREPSFQSCGGWGVLSVVVVHNCVDYPLRDLSLGFSCLFRWRIDANRDANGKPSFGG